MPGKDPKYTRANKMNKGDSAALKEIAISLSSLYSATFFVNPVVLLLPRVDLNVDSAEIAETNAEKKYKTDPFLPFFSAISACSAVKD